VKDRLGINYDDCRKVNPRIVYGSISGFGQSGPYRDRPGVDQIAQGMGGLMSVTGLPGQGPVRVGIPIADLSAGMYLAIGVLTALLEREVSGEGQWVHTSLLEAQLAMLDFQVPRWTMAGEVPPQAGNNHPTSVPTGVFETSDGHINIAASGGTMFERMANCLGAPELLTDERFANNKARQQHREELNEAIATYTRQNTAAHWVAAMNEAGVPCGPIYSVDQACADEQVQHLGFVVPVEHPQIGKIDIARHATNLSRTPHQMRNATPEQGEHTDAILADLGYSAEQIADLHEKRVV
jgi:formyl-CoA transferase